MKKASVFLFACIICITGIVCRKMSKPLPGLEEFKQEAQLEQIVQTLHQFADIEHTNSQQITQVYTTLRGHVNYLVQKYGKERAKLFAVEMLKKTQGASNNARIANGDCCHLKANGTTDQSCCSFWESIVVAFETIDCSRPYPGAPLKVINEFYECIQAEVCENC